MRDDRDDHQWQSDLQLVHQALYQKCLELGGLPSAEHGIGTAKVSYYNDAIPETNRQLMRAIKQQFDPKNLLNNQVYTTII